MTDNSLQMKRPRTEMMDPDLRVSMAFMEAADRRAVACLELKHKTEQAGIDREKWAIEREKLAIHREKLAVHRATLEADNLRMKLRLQGIAEMSSMCSTGFTMNATAFNNDSFVPGHQQAQAQQQSFDGYIMDQAGPSTNNMNAYAVGGGPVASSSTLGTYGVAG